MFSFHGDTVLDPFTGTATTILAAAKVGRNAVGVEIDPSYFRMAKRRLDDAGDLFRRPVIEIVEPTSMQP